jgi:AraC-like DNA-binding protein
VDRSSFSGQTLQVRESLVPAEDAPRARPVLRSTRGGAAALSAEAQTSIVWVRLLLGALLKRGIDGAALFDEMQVTPSLLGDSRVRISIATWHALVQRTLTLCRDDGLGLAIGASAPESALRITGQLALASDTLRDALRAFERYHAILADVRFCGLVEEGERAYIVYAPPPARAAALVRFDAELALSLMYRIALHFLRPHGADITELWLAHPAPAYAARYDEVFRCPVRFGRPRNAIVLERSALDRSQGHADRWYIELLRECAERTLAEQRAPSFPDQVRALLRHEVGLRGAVAARVARLFKLDGRQLRHRLLRCDVRWSSLVDEARREIACDELQRGDTTLRDLAERLGFSDQSAFNRAFKRWTGVTPARYAHRVR